MLFDKPIQLDLGDRSILDAKPIYFNFRLVNICLVGCGGTGSFLVPHLARIANFYKEVDRQIEITLIDFDEIELKNLYRQNFCPGELGWNKAEALALRYKTIYPHLKITALASEFDYLLLPSQHPALIIGCCDNAETRREMAALTSERTRQKDPSSPVWWLDCGNDYVHGQVAIGNLDSTDIEDYRTEPLTCNRLPLPSLQYPQLLEEDTKPEESLSCAERAMLNGQSLNINCHIAAIAAEMINQLLHSQLKRMNVEIDIFRGSMRSTFTSQENINAAVVKAGRLLDE